VTEAKRKRPPDTAEKFIKKGLCFAAQPPRRVARAMAGQRIVCVSCGQTRYPKFQRLCWKCAAKPEIRARHWTDERGGRRGIPDRYGASPPCLLPTDAPPGSEEKILVLMERAANGQSLFHEGDRLIPDPSGPLYSLLRPLFLLAENEPEGDVA
jgi:hypothetical protein